MRRDHEAALSAALDQLYLQGSAPILWNHLYLWYNADRLSRGVYSDIIARWQELCEGYGHKISEVPNLKELRSSDTWLLLTRDIFKGEEELTSLSDRL